MQAETMTEVRKMTKFEIGVLVKIYREVFQLSQDALAVNAGCSERTIQRIERGEGANADTLRRIAKAFDLPDQDLFTRTHEIRSAEELLREAEEFEKENHLVELEETRDPREIAGTFAAVHFFYYEVEELVERQAERTAHELVDYMRDYGDISELYNEVQRLDVYEHIEHMLAALSEHNVSLFLGRFEPTETLNGRPCQYDGAIVCFGPTGSGPKTRAVPRDFKLPR